MKSEIEHEQTMENQQNILLSNMYCKKELMSRESVQRKTKNRKQAAENTNLKSRSLIKAKKPSLHRED